MISKVSLCKFQKIQISSHCMLFTSKFVESVQAQFNDFLNLIFGRLLTYRPTVRRAVDANASHFFPKEDFPKIVGLCLECYSHTYLQDAIHQMHFFPNTYWIRATISIRRMEKILLLIKQNCIETSTNMKQVVFYGFCLHESNRWIALILQTCSDLLS